MGSYVFTSAGERPFENFSRDKKTLDAKIKKLRKDNNKPTLADWTIHDIRRTVASGMASLGTAPHIIEKILNHSAGIISGVAAVYNRYEYAEETKSALDAWGNHIQNILTTEDALGADNSVIIIPKKRRR